MATQNELRVLTNCSQGLLPGANIPCPISEGVIGCLCGNGATLSFLFCCFPKVEAPDIRRRAEQRFARPEPPSCLACLSTLVVTVTPSTVKTALHKSAWQIFIPPNWTVCRRTIYKPAALELNWWWWLGGPTRTRRGRWRFLFERERVLVCVPWGAAARLTCPPLRCVSLCCDRNAFRNIYLFFSFLTSASIGIHRLVNIAGMS